jgi:hypothetical protein
LKIAPEKPLDARKAARLILRGIDRNQFLILVTATAHALWRIHRYAPDASLQLGRVAIRRFRAVRREDD